MASNRNRKRRERRKRKRQQEVAAENGLRCPNCGGELAGQYDTASEENFWQCWDCQQSFALDMRPSFDGTSVAYEDAEEVLADGEGS